MCQPVANPGRRGGHLLRRTFILALLLISAGFVTSGTVELVFRYRESTDAIAALQREMAQAAAYKIGQFVRDIEKTLSTATHTRATVLEGLTTEFAFQLAKLMKVAPAVTAATVIAPDGRVLLTESRVAMEDRESYRDRSEEPAFRETVLGGTYFGPVYFVRNSEPYMHMAVPIEWFHGRIEGVLLAEINLKYIWDVVASIQVGKTGYAYVVSADGALIAHPDISLVLQNRRVDQLGQVRAALTGETGALGLHRNLAGAPVFPAYAVIPTLGWAVLVERNAWEAYAPLLGSVFRTAALLLVGLGMATFAALLIRRRVVQPVGVLRRGAERIGAGELTHRIDVRTGDELEALADAFNRMGAQLQSEREGLERSVRERTAELEVASRHKSHFLANMSHELRTPLNAILGYTELIRDGIYGAVPAKVDEVLTRIQVSGRHLLGLINDVLDLSKIEAGELRLFVADYSMNRVMKNVVDAMGALADAKRLHLVAEVPAELPIAHGDEQRITQVLLNLAGNAIKFTDEGKVGIRVAVDNGHFRISVSDTGPGIAANDRERIFDEFQQAGATTRPKGGTGLGLAIARRFIEMHGGRIWVESTTGEGSVFSFELPIRVDRGGAS